MGVLGGEGREEGRDGEADWKETGIQRDRQGKKDGQSHRERGRETDMQERQAGKDWAKGQIRSQTRRDKDRDRPTGEKSRRIEKEMKQKE